MSRIKRRKVKKSMVKEAPKKKKMSTQLIMTIIMGVLMIASIFGIMFSSYNSGSEEMEYGDYTFKRTATGWSTEIDGNEVEFSFLPQDVESLNVSEKVKEKMLQLKVAYITFNPNTKNVQDLELLRFEMSTALTQMFGAYLMPGITEENEVYTQPVIRCENATTTMPVINLVESNNTRTVVDGDCIILEVHESSVIALKDRLMYAMLGIIE